MAKINKLVRHADSHVQEILADIVKKLKEDYISDHQDSLRTREKYYVNLPYKQGVQIKPQKASDDNMSPTEQHACKEEIQQLLEWKLIDLCKISWAFLTIYVNKHSEKKRGKKILVVNYEVLNDALEPIIVSFSKQIIIVLQTC